MRVLLAALVFVVLERFWPALPAQPRWRKDSWTDVAYLFFTGLVSKPTGKFAAIVALVLVGAALGVRPRDLQAWTESRPFTHLPRAIQAPVILVVGDFFGYWRHRLFHRGRLWRFHAIHHCSRQLDWLSSVRLHPVDEIAGNVVQAVPVFLLGFSKGLLAAYVPFLVFYSVFVHANVRWSFGPLRWVITTPAFHRWHHTSQEEGLDKNFAGLLPLWDLLFGTFYLPRDRQAERFGVFHDDVPDGLWAQQLWPFRRPKPAPSTAPGV